jgi:3'(2'), 5'-bisphosphate nucleotidase
MKLDDNFFLEAESVLREIEQECSTKILDIYESNEILQENKSDGSPVTAADLAANEIIKNSLNSSFPHIPVLSEELEYPENIPETFWLVDPLDGTKEFIKKTDQFTINIALVHKSESIFGMVSAPAMKKIWLSAKSNQVIKTQESVFDHKINVATSASHTSSDDSSFLNFLKDAQPMPLGSSLKICLAADGDVDIYPRFGPTSEWDIAAANAVLSNAGGLLVDLESHQKLSYGKQDSVLNPRFIAISPYINSIEVLKLVEEFNKTLL